MKVSATLETQAPSSITFGGELQPRIERTLFRLPSDAGTIRQFLSELAACGMAPKSMLCYLHAIQSLLSMGKPLASIGKQDLIEWCSKLDGTAKQSTATRYKVLVKRFFKWMHTGQLDGDEYPEVVAWLKPHGKKRENLGKRILTRDDIEGMLRAAHHSQRNRAMVSVAYESGCRAGEFLGLRIGDVQIDRHGAVLRVNGKTGERRIRLIESVPDLQLWLSMHPRREDPEAPLWPKHGAGDKGLGRYAWCWILKQYAREIGLEKATSPHTLRHTRATHLAKVLKEAQMREFFGWSKGSDMPAIYVHLSGRDLDDTLFEHYGIKTDERERPKTFVLKRCPRCERGNSAGASYCMGCGYCLDVKLATSFEKDREAAQELEAEVIGELIKQAPEILERILSKRKLGERIRRLASKEAAGGNV